MRCPVVSKTHKTSLAELRHEKASLLSECESSRHRVAQWEEEEKARTAGMSKRSH